MKIRALNFVANCTYMNKPTSKIYLKLKPVINSVLKRYNPYCNNHHLLVVGITLFLGHNVRGWGTSVMVGYGWRYCDWMFTAMGWQVVIMKIKCCNWMWVMASSFVIGYLHVEWRSAIGWHVKGSLNSFMTSLNI